jgi:hypothetical protein
MSFPHHDMKPSTGQAEGEKRLEAARPPAPSVVRLTGFARPAWLENADLVALVGVATALWVLSVQQVEVREMTDLGLASVLPLLTFAALLVLTLSFTLCLRDPRSAPVLLIHLCALVVMLHGIAPLVEDVPRFSATWRHIGVAEHISRTGEVDPQIDAMFNWPGFFAFNAFVTDIAGVGSAVELAAWTPVFFNLLYLAPLVLIFRAATGDERLVWLSVWFFCIANWIGQDSFSPQGLSYFLYLVILAILLRWFTFGLMSGTTVDTGWAHTQGEGAVRSSFAAGGHPSLVPAKRVALLALVIAVFAALVPTHQLTAFAVFACAAVLLPLRRYTAQWLPVLMAVLSGGWIALAAVTSIAGDLDELIGAVGSVAGSVEQTLDGRARGSSDHQVIVHLRLVVTSVFWALGVLGAYRAFGKGRRDLPLALLAVATPPLLALQPYGGEILLRVYVFALPFVAFLVACAFYPMRSVVFTKRDVVRSWRATRVLLLASVALAIGFFFVRYGNERMDSFTSEEVEAVRTLYATAPPGSLLVAGNGNLPWRFEHYADYEYQEVVETESWRSLSSGRSSMRDVLAAVAGRMHHAGGGRAYLIISRSQKAAADLGSGPRGSLERFENTVAASPAFGLVYGNRDAAIYALADTGGGVE